MTEKPNISFTNDDDLSQQANESKDFLCGVIEGKQFESTEYSYKCNIYIFLNF